MRLALVISALGAGGAERVIVTLANAWAARGWQVALITFEPPGTKPYYHVDPRVALRQLGVPSVGHPRWRAIRQGLRRMRALRQALRTAAPDLVISFLAKINVLTLLASRGLAVPVVVSERNNPERQRFRGTWSWLRQLLYGTAWCVVTPSRGVLESFPSKIRARARHCQPRRPYSGSPHAARRGTPGGGRPSGPPEGVRSPVARVRQDRAGTSGMQVDHLGRGRAARGARGVVRRSGCGRAGAAAGPHRAAGPMGRGGGHLRTVVPLRKLRQRDHRGDGGGSARDRLRLPVGTGRHPPGRRGWTARAAGGRRGARCRHAPADRRPRPAPASRRGGGTERAALRSRRDHRAMGRSGRGGDPRPAAGAHCAATLRGGQPLHSAKCKTIEDACKLTIEVATRLISLATASAPINGSG